MEGYPWKGMDGIGRGEGVLLVGEKERLLLGGFG